MTLEVVLEQSWICLVGRKAPNHADPLGAMIAHPSVMTVMSEVDTTG